MLRYFFTFIAILCFLFIAFVIYGTQGNLTDNQRFSLEYFDFEYITSTPDTLTATTFNIGYLSGMTNNLPVDRSPDLFKNNLAGTIQLFNQYPTDILGFQEIDFGSARSCYYNQMDSLAKALRFPIAYKSVNWDKKYVPFPYWPPSKHFGEVKSGQTILSKLPVISHRSITLEKPANAGLIYNSYYLDRMVQVTQMKIGEDSICVMNVHLEAFDEQTRVEQSAKVIELYEQYAKNQAVLLMGDFNSPPGYVAQDDAMNQIMKANDIESAIDKYTYSSEPSSYFTFNSDSPYQMIDYILYNKSFIQPVAVKVLRSRTNF